jgi:hypothetical protein
MAGKGYERQFKILINLYRKGQKGQMAGKGYERLFKILINIIERAKKAI